MVDTEALWAMAGGALEAVEWLQEDLAPSGCTTRPGDLILGRHTPGPLSVEAEGSRRRVRRWSRLCGMPGRINMTSVVILDETATARMAVGIR